MNPSTETTPRVRVANFSSFELSFDHLLELDSGDHDEVLQTLRTHADLPYIYVVSKEQVGRTKAVLSALEAIRSPCYPYALFAVGGAELDVDGGSADVIEVDDETGLHEQVSEYVSKRMTFDRERLRRGAAGAPPERTGVVIVGAGLTGLYAAKELRNAGIDCCILERSPEWGGIWSSYANATSQVNTSECAYRLFEKTVRSNSDHSWTFEVLEDLAQLATEVTDALFLETEVRAVRRVGEVNEGYEVEYVGKAGPSVLKCKGVIFAINDRVGRPREVTYENQSSFSGQVVSGIADGARGVVWRDKEVVIVGMGAFAVENARTALEGGARHVTVLCRRHGTVCPKIIDYLNFATPYDEEFKHDRKSNTLNMMYWKKLYDLSGATQPECWMGKVKHDGHTISVSDIWFIGHHLKKLETRVGEITSMTEDGVVVDGEERIRADVVVNCVGFERQAPVVEVLSGYSETYNNNYLDRNLMYLADAYIDDEAFNSMFGSSVLEMVRFYVDLFIRFYDAPGFDEMLRTPGIEKLPITERKWSDYIKGSMSLMKRYPEIAEQTMQLVARRTENFLEAHDLETYIAENKREWLETHALLAGRPVDEAECLPYVFERLIRKK